MKIGIEKKNEISNHEKRVMTSIHEMKSQK